MDLAIASAGTALDPSITGFDLPSANVDEGSSKVAAVLLNEVPAPAWARAFSTLAAEFMQDHGLGDLRLLGATILLVGPLNKVRTLAPEVRNFVHRVSRLCLSKRVTWSADNDEEPGAGPANPGQPRTAIDPMVRFDLETIAAIVAMPDMLQAVCRATGMRFAAVARVTDTTWTACAVLDLIAFGLHPGQNLVLETTICNEIRQHGKTVVIERASTDASFAQHPTPAMYGFESYVSIPIVRTDGSFFGTLCALDPKPALLDEATLRTLEMFAAAIGREIRPR